VGSLSWWFAAHPAWEPGEDWPREVPVAPSRKPDGTSTGSAVIPERRPR
jgi:hypothetical protein